MTSPHFSHYLCLIQIIASDSLLVNLALNYLEMRLSILKAIMFGTKATEYHV
jgi:hypothetical protein